MAFTRRRADWKQYPDITTGTVDDTDFDAWDQGLVDAHAMLPADYMIYMSGGVAYAKSPLGTDYSGSDPAAVLQSAITALGTAGGTIVLRGALTWGSVPTLPKNISPKLHIRGTGSTIVTLSVAGPRFLDFNRTADNDTFQNIEVSDLVIDNNNVGGRGHVILGAYYTGGVAENGLLRANFDNIRCVNVTALNIPVDSTTTIHRIGFYPFTRHVSASEATTNYVRNIYCENVRIEGGNIGFTVGGTGPSASIINIEYDNVEFVDCYHSLGVVPTVNYSSANYQIGVRARATAGQGASVAGSGKSVRMTRCFGEYSGDVAIEIDCPQDAVVDGCHMKDAYTNGFYTANNTPVTNPERQQWLFSNCTYTRRDVIQGCGFKATSSDGNACGRYKIRDCQVHVNEPTGQNGGVYGFQFSGSSSVPSYEEIDIDGFKVIAKGLTHVFGDATVAMNAIVINGYGSSTVRTIARLRDIGIRMEATRTGGGNSVFLTGIQLAGILLADVEGVNLNFQASGLQANSIIGMDVGTISGSSIEGTIGKVRARALWTGDTAPRGISIRGTSTLAIPTRLDIENCDFTLAPAGIVDVLFTAAPLNQDKVYFRGNKWRTYPKPSAAMGTTNFAAATFTTATGNQYIGGDSAEIHFATGTGAAVTAIDVSKDGTTYENAYTQASGAMAQSVLVPVDNGDYVKVTFATTQPTTRVRFRK
jgi:hypothetical protein